MSIISTKVYEYAKERDGRKYVIYEFLSEYGDVQRIGPVLEAEDVDAFAKSLTMAEEALASLAAKEKQAAYDLAVREGINPADLSYKYNVKAAIINDMYSSKLLPEEQEAANALSTVQNVANKVRLFLGLI